MFETCFKVRVMLSQIELLLAECATLMPRHTPSFRAILQHEMGDRWMVTFAAERRDSENLLALYELNRKYTVIGHCSLMTRG